MENLTEKVLTALIEKTEKGEIQWIRNIGDRYDAQLNELCLSISPSRDKYIFSLFRKEPTRIGREYRSTGNVNDLILQLYICASRHFYSNSETVELLTFTLEALEALEAPKPSSTPTPLTPNP